MATKRLPWRGKKELWLRACPRTGPKHVATAWILHSLKCPANSCIRPAGWSRLISSCPKCGKLWMRPPCPRGHRGWLLFRGKACKVFTIEDHQIGIWRKYTISSTWNKVISVIVALSNHDLQWCRDLRSLYFEHILSYIPIIPLHTPSPWLLVLCPCLIIGHIPFHKLPSGETWYFFYWQLESQVLL